MLSPPRILITGGAGFIGSHAAERLVREGAAVTVLDDFNDYYDPALKHRNLEALRGRIHITEGDIRDRSTVEKICREGEFDTILHLAARVGIRPSIADPELYLSTNVTGTFRLLEAARLTGVKRFIFASSSSVYGANRSTPFREEDPVTEIISPYAVTKLAGEQWCSNYANLYGLRCICLRFFTVYGPRQRPDLAISKFTRLIHEGKPVPRYGDGLSARDYTYVDDIVDGIAAALHYNGAPFEIFNLGGSRATTLNELIEAIASALQKKAVIEPLPDQPGDVPLTCADLSKARRLLGYHPQTPVTAGIPRFVAWFLKQHSAAF